jgi:hypothetical protein
MIKAYGVFGESPEEGIHPMAAWMMEFFGFVMTE